METDEVFRRRTAALKASWRVATFKGPSPSDELEKFNPDLIYCHNLFPNFGYEWIERWSSRTIATLHNYRTLCAAGTLTLDGKHCEKCPEHGSHNAVINKCYRKSGLATLPLAISARKSGHSNPLLNKAKRIIVLNEAARKVYEPIVGKDRLRLGPTLAFPAEIATRPSVRRYWLYIGRLTPEKGIGLLIKGWPASEELVVAGAGPLAPLVKEASERLANIKFVGQVGPEQKHLLYTQAYGLLLPSQWSEGLPVVIPEALSAGCPVLASNKVSAASHLEDCGGVVIHDYTLPAHTLALKLSDLRRHQSSYSDSAKHHYDRFYSVAAWWRQMQRINTEVLG